MTMKLIKTEREFQAFQNACSVGYHNAVQVVSNIREFPAIVSCEFVDDSATAYQFHYTFLPLSTFLQSWELK